MPKIKIDKNLLAKAKKVSEIAGYSNVEELIIHLIEKEIIRYDADSSDGKVTERLRGLGYIE